MIHKTIGAQVSDELYRRVEEFGWSHRIRTSEIVRIAVERYLADEERERQAQERKEAQQ